MNWKTTALELHELLTELLLKLEHDSDNNEGRRKADPFILTIKRQKDELVSMMPKE